MIDIPQLPRLCQHTILHSNVCVNSDKPIFCFGTFIISYNHSFSQTLFAYHFWEIQSRCRTELSGRIFSLLPQNSEWRIATYCIFWRDICLHLSQNGDFIVLVGFVLDMDKIFQLPAQAVPKKTQ
jgi:hypothetical protein